MSAYFPQRTFNGVLGQPSIDLGGPDELEKNIDELCKMFDPSATHGDGTPGGLSPENFVGGKIEASGITVEQIQGLIGTNLQALLESVKALIDQNNAAANEGLANRYTKSESDAKYEPIGGGGSGVTSFNGRRGAVTPQSGDYTPDMVGAFPVRGNITASTNLGNIQDGIWSVASANASFPVTNVSMYGFLIQYNPSYKTQLLVAGDSAGANVYCRRYANNAWSAWSSIPSSASPAFTGTPTAPTAPAGTNTTQLATTQFVQQAVSGKQNKAFYVQTTLGASLWVNNTQQITVPTIAYNSLIVVSPGYTSVEKYAAAGIYCTGHTNQTLTFTCKTVPTENIGVTLLVLP